MKVEESLGGLAQKIECGDRPTDGREEFVDDRPFLVGAESLVEDDAEIQSDLGPML